MARRKLIWARMPTAISSLSNVNAGLGGAVESQDLLAGFRAEAGLLKGPVGLTVMRVRMTVSFDIANSAQTDSIRANGGIYYGIRVFDTQEMIEDDTNEKANRGPVLDPHADWMAYGRVPVKASAGTTAAQWVGWEHVDVRAMRKVEELGHTLGLYLQTTSAAATGNVSTVTASISVLVALP